LLDTTRKDVPCRVPVPIRFESTRIDALNLLTAIDELLIPETVYAELEQGGIPPELSALEWERIEVVKPVENSAELDAG
jgi:hypothetical protein